MRARQLNGRKASGILVSFFPLTVIFSGGSAEPHTHATGTIGVLERATVAWLFAADSWPSAFADLLPEFRLLFWIRRKRR